jgi:redox-sensitive bicupin YhaK (pirin superfamily)
VSGPVDRAGAPPDDPEGSSPEPPTAEVADPREATVGTLTVRRVLPRRQRRTVGAWCFVDHFGPAEVQEDGGVDIGPHPHTGLHTVTYLLDGQVLHRDSLGTEQVIRPGQLNLMTAGRGLSHAEEPTGHYHGTLHGVQLWVAQPEGTRHGDSAFEHHAELPRVELPGAEITVLVGGLGEATAPSRTDTPLVGVDVALRPGGTTVPLAPTFEHVLVVLDGLLVVDDAPVERGQSAYLGVGRDEVVLTAPDGARLLLLGGEPFAEPLLMWWNFVARTRAEIDEARRQWAAADDRFGRVASRLARVPSPPAPWTRAS